MTHDTAKQFWQTYVKLICASGTKTLMLNPVYTFTEQAYLGQFEALPDDEYEDKLQDTKELSTFWDDHQTETPVNILLNALAETNISDIDIDNIAEILADASARSQYNDKNSNRKLYDEHIITLAPNPNAEYDDWTPHSIYDYLNQHIYGQEAAKRAVSMLVYNHLHGNSRNIVMAGATGCGKTEIWRVLSKKLDCIRIINGPQLSGDGWKGSYKISDIFADEPEQMAGNLIIVIDEADKMCEPTFASGGNDVSKIIQNELLKLMDGDTLTFANENNRDKKTVIDCSGISVVLCGSFERMLQAKSESFNSIGFGQSEKKESRIAECTEEDLIQYGNVRREIAGRISRIVTLDTLNASDFEAILQSPASPIQKIEKSHQVSLSVDENTRKKLAYDAAESGLGCRYIRSKLQNMLDEQMFDAPEAGEYELCCR